MKGEITGSKRHLKGHKSKLSFSRFDDPRVTSRLFPHSIVFPRNARWANHQVINCSPAWPQIWRKIGKTRGSALISLVIRARFLKKPQTTSSVLSPSPRGGEEALLGEKTSQREFSRKEGSTRCCSVLRRKWKASFRVLSPSRCDLDKPAWNSPLKFPTVAWNKAKVRERHGTQCQKTERRLSQEGKFSGGEIRLSLSVLEQGHLSL